MRVSRIFFITAHVGILILGYFFVKRYSGLFFLPVILFIMII